MQKSRLLVSFGKDTLVVSFDEDKGELDLSCQKLMQKDIPAICELLNKYPSARSLNLSGNKLGDEGAKALAKALASDVVTIQSLNVANNNITDEGVKALANTTLQSLDVSFNEISDEGFKAFSTNTTIRTLSATWNEISDEGAKAVLNANTTLQSLNLAGNDLSNAVIKAISNELIKRTGSSSEKVGISEETSSPSSTFSP